MGGGEKSLKKKGFPKTKGPLKINSHFAPPNQNFWKNTKKPQKGWKKTFPAFLVPL